MLGAAASAPVAPAVLCRNLRREKRFSLISSS
jgi:hypothetical protein